MKFGNGCDTSFCVVIGLIQFVFPFPLLLSRLLERVHLNHLTQFSLWNFDMNQ